MLDVITSECEFRLPENLCDAKGTSNHELSQTHDISWATHRWVKVHFHRLSTRTIPSRNRVLFTTRWKSSWIVPRFNWKPSGRPPRDTAARSFYERSHITHKYTYAYQYVHVLFLVPRKLIIYSRVSSLCSWVIKPRRYSHQSSERMTARLRYVPCAVSRTQSVGHTGAG